MDINISANTLFHFTTNEKALLNILSNGIYVRYCLENYENLITDEAELVIPMACFCDIPLSQSKRHKDIYGDYAIGFKKEWGMKNKINPVIYSYPGSSTTEILNDLYGDLGSFFQIDSKELSPKKSYTFPQIITKNSENNLSENDFNKIGWLRGKLGHFLRYIKPYEGKFYRGSDYLEKTVKFYEEREWRYVPSIGFFDEKIDLKDSYKKEYYTDPIKRRAINMKLAKHLKLTFSPEDVRFIVVKTDKEIPNFLKKLDEIFGNKISSNNLKLLGTRLISFEQIIQDL